LCTDHPQALGTEWRAFRVRPVARGGDRTLHGWAGPGKLQRSLGALAELESAELFVPWILVPDVGLRNTLRTMARRRRGAGGASLGRRDRCWVHVQELSSTCSRMRFGR
jgi:hypothetical protein